ncbi:MAG: glycosyltransferase [Lachnospiraceae bacterium]|nr:glycosyltransferase [Lachnospiraceae bacterium]
MGAYVKILYIEWASFGNEDMKEAFTKEGHTLVCLPFSNKDTRRDEVVEAEIASTLHLEVPDVVFSFNYFPLISNVCKKENIRYISWIYDSPYVKLYSYTAINPCNTIYVFDKELYLEFHNAGINTVHYMPMAANVERLDRLKPNKSGKDPEFLYDISFVGSLYTEKHNFYDRMTNLSDYARGYLDAVMAAQMQIQGYNFVQTSISPIIGDLQKALPMEPNPDGVETIEYLYAQYVINRKITGIERIDLISEITKKHTFDLFTHDPNFQMPNLNNRGRVDNYQEMPLVFKQSKINLNISLRSIKSGIPQRAFDIMGSGSFLISNYQNDFLDYFTPGEDFDIYDSKTDLINKIDYYLSHDDERMAIARNGHDKIAIAHTYCHRVREMLDNII